MFYKFLILILLISSCSSYNMSKDNIIDIPKNSNIIYANTISIHHLNDINNNMCYGNSTSGFFYFDSFSQINQIYKSLDYSIVNNNIYRLAIQYKKLIENLKKAYSLPEYVKIENLLTQLLATFNHDIFEVNKFIEDSTSYQKLLEVRLQALEEIDSLLLRLPLFSPLNNTLISLDYLAKPNQNIKFHLKSNDDKIMAAGRGRVKLHKTSSNDVIEIQHTSDISSFYENLKEILVKDNALVEVNQVIATAKENLYKEKMIYYYIKYNDKFIKPSIFMFHYYNCE